MKRIILILTLAVPVFGQAKDTKFVDIALWDTKVVTTLGDSQFSGKGCAVVLYGPAEGEVSSNTYSGRTCQSIKDSAIESLTDKGVGIYSATVNGIELLKDIKP